MRSRPRPDPLADSFVAPRVAPGVITGITPSPRKPGRFSLEVEGHEVALISIEAIERLKLGTGRTLDERSAA